MARKVFISFLGYSNYRECYYKKGNFISKKVRYIQEATLDYIINTGTWTKDDIAFILLTDGAEKKNWVDNGHIDITNQEVIVQKGLKSQLDMLQLPMRIEPITNLPEGNNESDIWSIFQIIYNKIEQDDEVYFDITHGFRYLPMLTLVLSNYSKFLKNIKINHISYGNYEGRDVATNIAPIIDLTPLTTLQDWTYAAGQYIDTGNVNKMVELSNEQIKPLLKEEYNANTENVRYLNKFTQALSDVIEERRFCRGNDIIESKKMNKLKSNALKLEETFIPALNPIFDKIKDSLICFDVNKNIYNGFYAAKWCMENGLYQQAVTILRENIITLFCTRINLDNNDHMSREKVSRALISCYKEAINSRAEDNVDTIEVLDNLKKYSDFNYLFRYFGELNDLRNDINHAGMRPAPMQSKKIKEKIEELVNNILNIVLLESNEKEDIN